MEITFVFPNTFFYYSHRFTHSYFKIPPQFSLQMNTQDTFSGRGENDSDTEIPLPHSSPGEARQRAGADLKPGATRKNPRTKKTQCKQMISDPRETGHVGDTRAARSERQHHAWTHLIELNELRVRPWHLNSNLHYVLLLRHFDTWMPVLLKLWGEGEGRGGRERGEEGGRQTQHRVLKCSTIAYYS